MADRTTERRRYARTAAKFDKLAAANKLIDAGGEAAADGRRVQRDARDKWTNRESRNTNGFHRKVKSAPVTIRKGIA